MHLTHRSSTPIPYLLAATLLALALPVLPLLSAPPASAQSAIEFPGLEAGQRVYDRTGESLTEVQMADLQQRLDELQVAGADGIVYVRELDASPEDTFDQVEALQQAWVGRTGTDQNTAVAVLINRNPDDPEDARAGVFVGRTFQDGNVPEDEQVAIVEDALIPPLRDGDVYASLVAGIDRLTNSVRTGPPVSDFEVWAEGVAGTWLPWATIAVALILLAAALALYRRRQTTDRPDTDPTTIRPGELAPALAAALAAGGAQAHSVPATLLDLAGRGAVAIEPEPTPEKGGDPAIQVRLLDSARTTGPVEGAVWSQLQDRADGGLVSSKDLKKLADTPKPVNEAIEEQMRAQGWLDPDATGPRSGLIVIGLVAIVLAILTFIVVAASGRAWPSIVGAIALALLLPVTLLLFSRYPRLSQEGQEAAIPWKAYREGLKRAVKDGTVAMDLDAVLPDVVAVGQGSALDDRLEAAAKSGQILRAFSSTQSSDMMAYLPMWLAFQSSTTSTSSASGGTVSGVGAGGGGGAAGST